MGISSVSQAYSSITTEKVQENRKLLLLQALLKPGLQGAGTRTEVHYYLTAEQTCYVYGEGPDFLLL